MLPRLHSHLISYQVYVRASSFLFSNPDPGSRFADVFTKLRAFELVEYSEILLLDSDLLVTQNIDHLFALRSTPAAVLAPIFGGGGAMRREEKSTLSVMPFNSGVH